MPAPARFAVDIAVVGERALEEELPAFRRRWSHGQVHLLVGPAEQSARHRLLVVLPGGVPFEALEHGHGRHQVALVEQGLGVRSADGGIVEAADDELGGNLLEQQKMTPATQQPDDGPRRAELVGSVVRPQVGDQLGAQLCRARTVEAGDRLPQLTLGLQRVPGHGRDPTSSYPVGANGAARGPAELV